MSGDCIPVEELARVVALPEGDPGRRHLDRCTRCQALAEMLRGFESPAPRSPEAGFEAVDDRLLATIAELTGASAASAAAARGEGARAPAPAPRRASPWWRIPSLRYAGAFAALLVVSAVGVGLWRSQRAEPTLRSVPAPGGVTFASAPAREVPGGLELSWSAVAEAEAYQVVFLDDGLREIARLSPTPGTTLRLVAGALPAGLTPGATVGWQVEALAGGDRLRATPTRALRVP